MPMARKLLACFGFAPARPRGPVRVRHRIAYGTLCRMKRSRMGLARQLGLLLVLPIALTFGAYGTLSQRSRHQALMAEASAELRNHATLVEAAVGGAVERGQVQLLKDRLERIARADRILGIAAFDAGGRPILVTDHLEAAQARLGQIAKRAAERGTDFEESSDLGGGPTLTRTVTLSANTGGPVIAVVARDLGYVEKLNASLNRGLAVTGLALLFAALGLVMLLTRATVGRPAGAIVAGAERIASGDLTTTVPETGAEELARLARAFNTMTRSLGDARSRAEQEVSRRLAEEEGRVAAERKLQHARALAAVGRVAASIGHEIGSPLGVILGRARLLADQPGCAPEIRGDLETIADQSERISRVVARLLAVARPPQASGKWSDACRVARDVLQFLGPECRQRRIETRVEPGAGEFRVELEGDQLFQVLFNLCWNAIEAQPDGGRLTLRVAGENSRVAIDVSDAGPGVPSELADRIFDPFFTTKADRSGSGLGLDIVSGIVQEVGGSVRLADAAGAGACFRVTLPAAPDGAPVEEVAALVREAS